MSDLCTKEESSYQNQLKKRKIKVLILLGYLGGRFHGSASNSDTLHPTIEDIVLSVLHECELIDKRPGDDDWANKISFQRASRTDKGVDAIRNALSLNIRYDCSHTLGFTRLISKLNTMLPDEIHIFDIIPVTSSFSSYKECTGRVYSYYLPEYALLGPESYSRYVKFVELNFRSEGSHSENSAGNFLDNSTFSTIESFLPTENELTANLDRANNLLQKYVGTKSFHNFTLGGDPKSPRMMRYITEASIVHERNQYHVTLRGQSFMHHQIRKMVSAVLCTVNHGLNDSFFESLLQKDVRVHIPMLPSSGLVLENLYFQKYNLKLTRIQCHGNAAGRPKVEFSSDDKRINEFSFKVLGNIAKTEKLERAHAKWLFSTKMETVTAL